MEKCTKGYFEFDTRQDGLYLTVYPPQQGEPALDAGEVLYYIEKKNIITRAVGTGREVDIDLFALKLKSRDYVLMCSDGLSNMVDEFEIEYIIRSEEGMRQKVESLVAAANRNGGRDNISVVLIEPQISEVSL